MRIAAFYENLLTAAQEENKSIEQILREAREMGLQAVYISGDSLSADPEGILRMLDAIGLPVEGLHQHFDFGHHPEDTSYRPLMELAAKAGARNFLVVPGMLHPGDDDACVERMIQATAEVTEYGRSLGLDVCMEDFDNLISPFRNAPGLARFLDAIPDLGCAFDTGNFITDGEDPMAVLPRFADRICLLHLKDRWPADDDPTNGVLCLDGHYRHTAPVGSGEMPVREVLDELNRRGYQGNGVVELYGITHVLEDLRSSLEYLRRIGVLVP